MLPCILLPFKSWLIIFDVSVGNASNKYLGKPFHVAIDDKRPQCSTVESDALDECYIESANEEQDAVRRAERSTSWIVEGTENSHFTQTVDPGYALDFWIPVVKDKIA